MPEPKPICPVCGLRVIVWGADERFTCLSCGWYEMSDSEKVEAMEDDELILDIEYEEDDDN